MIVEYGMPKYRSADTGMIITREQTHVLRNVFSVETVKRMVQDGLLIPCGRWPDIVEERSWQELCDNSLYSMAVKRYKETHNCSVREALDAVNKYREDLKKKYQKK